MGELIEQAVGAVARPPRSRYDPESIPEELVIPNYGRAKRTKIQFPNSRGLKIFGNFYSSENMADADSCVIYLHGNASCQLEGTFLIPFMIPHNIAVLCFDFSGCGLSEGKFISLGLLEKNDVACAITYIQVHFGISKVVLWGRSMGAACSFLCINNEQELCGIIADSPFSSLSELVKDLATSMGVPGFLSPIAMRILSSKIEDKYGYDIKECSPIENVNKAVSPLFLIHGRDDSFIPCKHSQLLFDSYAGADKTIRIVPGDHNGSRPNEVTGEAIMFIARCLGKVIEVGEISMQIDAGSLHFGNLEDLISGLQEEDEI